MSEEKDEVETTDPHFEPIITLPQVETKSLEEEEEQVYKSRAKLYRYDSAEEPPEWKERGTGDVKILKHKETGLCRILMRRDKTLKICANHYLAPIMELKPNCGNDRAWVWSTPADFSDQEPKPELLAIRFRDADTAQKFKTTFDVGKHGVKLIAGNGDAASPAKPESTSPTKEEDKSKTEEDEVTDKLDQLTVKEEDKSESTENSGGDVKTDLETKSEAER